MYCVAGQVGYQVAYVHNTISIQCQSLFAASLKFISQFFFNLCVNFRVEFIDHVFSLLHDKILSFATYKNWFYHFVQFSLLFLKGFLFFGDEAGTPAMWQSRQSHWIQYKRFYISWKSPTQLNVCVRVCVSKWFCKLFSHPIDGFGHPPVSDVSSSDFKRLIKTRVTVALTLPSRTSSSTSLL